jgi:hypothetical protein
MPHKALPEAAKPDGEKKRTATAHAATQQTPSAFPRVEKAGHFREMR